MQGELYTERPFGEYGLQRLNRSKLLGEMPDYVVFNGAVGGLTKEHPLQAKVGETVRIFFGVGCPNLISSFHIIGEHFDRLYNLASLDEPTVNNCSDGRGTAGGSRVSRIEVGNAGTISACGSCAIANGERIARLSPGRRTAKSGTLLRIASGSPFGCTLARKEAEPETTEHK